MLQRIQTVWLFLATICLYGLFLFPFLQVLNVDGAAKVVKVTGVYQNINGQIVQTEQFLALTILTAILGLIPFAIIFFYKKRKRQLVFCYTGVLAILLYSYWLSQTAKAAVGNIDLDFGNYGIGVILPSLAIVFIILAGRGIRNDEKLIKSADRLR